MQRGLIALGRDGGMHGEPDLSLNFRSDPDAKPCNSQMQQPKPFKRPKESAGGQQTSTGT